MKQTRRDLWEPRGPARPRRDSRGITINQALFTAPARHIPETDLLGSFGDRIRIWFFKMNHSHLACLSVIWRPIRTGRPCFVMIRYSGMLAGSARSITSLLLVSASFQNIFTAPPLYETFCLTTTYCVCKLYILPYLCLFFQPAREFVCIVNTTSCGHGQYIAHYIEKSC